MKIYEVTSNLDIFAACQINIERGQAGRSLDRVEAIWLFDGTPRKDCWSPVWLELVDSDNCELGDYIYGMGDGPLFLKSNVAERMLYLFKNAEILSVKCDFGNYCIVNILDVLDCIDYSKADAIYFKSSLNSETPRVMRFKSYAFDREKIGDCHIFKIVEFPCTTIFADEVFVQAIEEMGITGFEFNLIWEG